MWTAKSSQGGQLPTRIPWAKINFAGQYSDFTISFLLYDLASDTFDTLSTDGGAEAGRRWELQRKSLWKLSLCFFFSALVHPLPHPFTHSPLPFSVIQRSTMMLPYNRQRDFPWLLHNLLWFRKSGLAMESMQFIMSLNRGRSILEVMWLPKVIQQLMIRLAPRPDSRPKLFSPSLHTQLSPSFNRGDRLGMLFASLVLGKFYQYLNIKRKQSMSFNVVPGLI